MNELCLDQMCILHRKYSNQSRFVRSNLYHRVKSIIKQSHQRFYQINQYDDLLDRQQLVHNERDTVPWVLCILANDEKAFLHLSFRLHVENYIFVNSFDSS